MMWMYSGWESMSTLAGEIENPQKVIPKALMIGTPLVIATYFITVWAAIRIADLGGPDNYLNMWTGGGGEDFVQLAEVVGGAFFGYLMLMSAILSNIGLYAGYLATGARPQFQMSRDRLLPRFLGLTHGSWGTPWAAILLMGVRQRGADQLQLRRSDHHRRLPAHVPLRAHLLTVMIMRVRARHPALVPGAAADLGARRLGRLPDRRRSSACRQRHQLDDRRARGILAGPIAYLVFKNTYKAPPTTRSRAPPSPRTGELTESAPQWKEERMKGQHCANDGDHRHHHRPVAIGDGLYAARSSRCSASRVLRICSRLSLRRARADGPRDDHGRRRPAQLQVAERRRHQHLRRRMIGLIYTYDRGMYRWTPSCSAGEALTVAWIGGIFAGYAAYKNVPQNSGKLAGRAPARRSKLQGHRHPDEAPGPPAAAQASR